MGTSRVLVVDHHNQDGQTRIADLKAVIKKVAGCDPDWLQQVYGDTRETTPSWNIVKTDCVNRLRSMDLVVMHCGGQQHCVLPVLAEQELNNVPILLYSGGAVDNTIRVFARANPPRLALIEETFGLLGLQEQQKEKLEAAIRLILVEKKTPGEAVETAYGDPELEKILEELYSKLVAGADLNELRVERDAALEAHYRERRGW